MVSFLFFMGTGYSSIFLQWSIVYFIVYVCFRIRFDFKICLLMCSRGVFLALYIILKFFNIACLVLGLFGYYPTIRMLDSYSRLFIGEERKARSLF